jgi:DNA-binding HxlR family transcriptional regulator
MNFNGCAGLTHGQARRYCRVFPITTPGIQQVARERKMKSRFDVHLGVTPTLFIGKWTVRVLFLLKERPYRHAQMRRRLGAISQRMLTRTLRNLESTGFISRKVTQSRSVTVSYSLTKLGRSFMVPVNSICRWIDRNRTGLRATIDVSK